MVVLSKRNWIALQENWAKMLLATLPVFRQKGKKGKRGSIFPSEL